MPIRAGGSDSSGRWRAPGLIGILLLSLLGCGQSGTGFQSSAKEETAAANGGDPASSSTRKSAATGKKKSKGRSGRHIGEIPKDAWPEIFFDEPLTVVKENDPIAAADKGNPQRDSTPPSKPAQEAELLPPPLESGEQDGASNWAALLSGEDLASECMAIRSSLTAKLQSVGKYSGNYKELRIDAGTLAALAGIAGEHPEAPGWKADARYVRDLSGEIVKSASANGDKFYKPTRAAFDKLDALFSGSKPPDLEEAAEKVAFSEVVSRVPLMYRMERAFNYLKLNVNTESLLKKEAAKVAHEGAVLAALAKVIAAPGYDDADLDDYRRFASELQVCGTGVVEAVKNGDFTAYTAALDRGHKACTQCHDNFKNN